MSPERELAAVAYLIAAEAFEVASKVGNWATMASKLATMAFEVDKQVTGALKADMLVTEAFKVATGSLKKQAVGEYIVEEASFLGLTEAIAYLLNQNQVEQVAEKLPLGLVVNLVQLNYREELCWALRD